MTLAYVHRAWQGARARVPTEARMVAVEIGIRTKGYDKLKAWRPRRRWSRVDVISVGTKAVKILLLDKYGCSTWRAY